MTCIVGIAHEGSVLIGGDSAGSDGYSITIRADQKVWAAGGWVYGFTTSFRMGQLLRWRLRPPANVRNDLHEYMATDFVDAVRATLRDAGWLRTESNRDEGGTFLVGVQGRLFAVQDDFQVAEASDGYAAVGSGARVALGALYASTRVRDPRRRIQVALEAAERFSPHVRRPFVIAESPTVA